MLKSWTTGSDSDRNFNAAPCHSRYRHGFCFRRYHTVQKEECQMTAVIVITIILWIYLLTVLRRAKLSFLTFLVGSVGLFILMMTIIQGYVTVPLSKAVAASVGVIGNLTGMFYAYYQYSLIFIRHGTESISLYIDYECSGVIELMAFSALLWFFPLYNAVEKLVVTLSGLLWIFASNILRLTVIC